MTPTERKYYTALGKLYQIERMRYGMPFTAMVMPYAIEKHGGWYTYICHALDNRNMMWNPDNLAIPCKEFLRKARIVSNQPADVK